MARHGRPRRSNEWEIKHEVVLGLMAGRPLTVVCRDRGISVSTAERWQEEDADFAEHVAAARALGWDALATECLDIADDSRNDYVEQFDDEGGHAGWRLNPENVQRSALRIKTRLDLLRVWDGTRYGLTNGVKLSAQVEQTTTHVVRHTIDPRSLDDAGRAALTALLVQAQAQGLLPPPADDDDVIEGEALPSDDG